MKYLQKQRILDEIDLEEVCNFLGSDKHLNNLIAGIINIAINHNYEEKITEDIYLLCEGESAAAVSELIMKQTLIPKDSKVYFRLEKRNPHQHYSFVLTRKCLGWSISDTIYLFPF